MGKVSIATRQVFFLVTALIVIPGHFFLIKIFLGWAGRDSWLGMVVGLIFGTVIFLAMAILSEKLYGKSLVLRATETLGPFFGRMATVPLILYFIVHSVLTIYGYSIFITAVFLPMHPLWVVATVFCIAVFYTTHLGIEVIARVSEWIIILNILAGTFVSFSLKPLKDYKKLLPILENGVEPIVPVILAILALLGELIVLLMVNINRDDKKSLSHKKAFFISFLGILIILPSTAAGAVAIFGVTQAKGFMYPVESMVRLINVGFIERFDIYGLTIMSVSAYLRLALLHYGASLGISQWLKLKNYQGVNWILGFVLIVVSLRVFDTPIDFYNFLRKYYMVGLLFSATILVLCAVVLIVPKLKKPGAKASASGGGGNGGSSSGGGGGSSWGAERDGTGRGNSADKGISKA